MSRRVAIDACQGFQKSNICAAQVCQEAMSVRGSRKRPLTVEPQLGTYSGQVEFKLGEVAGRSAYYYSVEHTINGGLGVVVTQCDACMLEEFILALT